MSAATSFVRTQPKTSTLTLAVHPVKTVKRRKYLFRLLPPSPAAVQKRGGRGKDEGGKVSSMEGGVRSQSGSNSRSDILVYMLCTFEIALHTLEIARMCADFEIAWWYYATRDCIRIPCKSSRIKMWIRFCTLLLRPKTHTLQLLEGTHPTVQG